MIVATAGHVDHGKTALVRALTGVETDRLPEEKRRGLTIDLGFAYRRLERGAVLGFVDVPGHERFVPNMLAGLGAIDRVLLVIAADEGPMPQTLEHLAILDLLGLDRGAVVVTKTDRVDETRLAAARAEIAALVAGGPLTDALVFAVSARTGEGMAALESWLLAEAGALVARPVRGHARLAVDRCFTLGGVGLIVTGALVSGRIARDDELVVTPSGERVRVRGLHADDTECESAVAGQRVAANLAGRGLRKERIRRGDWLVAEALHRPTVRIDVRLRVPAGAARGLRSRLPVHVHLGAGDVTGRIHPLAGKTIAPGETGLAQIVLDRPVGAAWGDRLVLRDTSAQATLGGATVIDPAGPARGRAKPARLAVLEALALDAPVAALTALLDCEADGVELDAFAAARNLTAAELEAACAAVEAVRLGGGASARLIAPEPWRALKEALLGALDAWHAARPESPGPAPEQLRAGLERRVPAALLRGAIEALREEGAIAPGGARLARPSFAPAMAARDTALWAELETRMGAAEGSPPVVHELAKALDREPEPVMRLLERARGLGLVERVAANRYLLPAALARYQEFARGLANEGRRFSVAAYRDRAGVGRNFAIELLEHFDATGLTERDGEGRRLREG
jgi:selenocysteine-specific elongation factor